MIETFSLASSNSAGNYGKAKCVVFPVCVCVFAGESEREKAEKCQDLSLSSSVSGRMSGLYWLDGQQAAKFEVLYHWELLQTLDAREQRRQKQHKRNPQSHEVTEKNTKRAQNHQRETETQTYSL